MEILIHTFNVISYYTLDIHIIKCISNFKSIIYNTAIKKERKKGYQMLVACQNGSHQVTVINLVPFAENLLYLKESMKKITKSNRMFFQIK